MRILCTILWSTIFPVFLQIKNVKPEGILPCDKREYRRR